MNDFNNGGDMTIGGNFVITDVSQNEHNFLVNCSTDVLLEEHPFRMENLRLERDRKIKVAIPILGVLVAVIVAVATYAYFSGNNDTVTFLLGMGSLVVGFGAIKGVIEPNSFEIQERNAIKEIEMILKSRRVRVR